MSELPISSPYRSTPELPVDDAERDQLSTRLNDAFAAGTIDETAYRERLDQLYAATRLGELVPVVTGLPARQTYAQPDVGGPGPAAPGQLAPARAGNALSLGVVAAVAGAIVVVAVLLFLIVGFG